MDARWELRFEKLEHKLDSELDLLAHLKAQSQSQAESLTKLQALCDAKTEELISTFRERCVQGQVLPAAK